MQTRGQSGDHFLKLEPVSGGQEVFSPLCVKCEITARHPSGEGGEP